MSWNPVGQLVTGIGTSVARSYTVEASELVAEAHDQLRKSQAELDQKKDQNAKAKVNFITPCLPPATDYRSRKEYL